MNDSDLGTVRHAVSGGQSAACDDISSTAAPELARHHDPVTGLPDQVLFLDRIGKAIAAGHRDGRMTAVIHLGLSDAPDAQSPAGSELLELVTEHLLATVGSGDTVARLGPWEFGVIQHGPRQPVDVFSLCRRLQRWPTRSIDGGEAVPALRMTCGVAIADHASADPARYLRKAERALRTAESEALGTCRFADPVHDAAWRAQQRAAGELRRALREDQLELRYLPMVRPSNRHIVGFEALLRWNHPERGLLAAGEFLDVAEACGLMAEIDDWVIRQACAETAGWGCQALQVMVNISLDQFRDGNLPRSVDAALEASGLDPHRLVIEITEDYILDESECVLPVLHSLRSRGISITLDDFGTGISSLGVLQSFPFDRIKIDQKLVAEIQRQPVAGTITRLVIAVGRAIGMRVTAEGVDCDHKLDFLTKHGCEEVQGFYFGRPLAPSELCRLIDLVDAHATSPLWPPRGDDPVAA